LASRECGADEHLFIHATAIGESDEPRHPDSRAPIPLTKEHNPMKRLIASFAVLGLIAAPALATTTTAKPAAHAPAKPAKAKNKIAKKGVKAAKPAASTKTSG
jgi:hypothetical protein